MGYFFHYCWAAIPMPLEIALRHSIYDPDKDVEEVLHHEISLDLNWYFNSHRNKLNAEMSYFDFQKNVADKRGGFRFRLQWDVSM